MICPHCSTSLKYKERSNNICSGCKKEFAFEPKTHPLLLSDGFFNRTVAKLSGSNQLYFTAPQLQFALSRKKMAMSLATLGLIIAAIVSTFIAAFIYFPLAVILFAFWIIFLTARKFFYVPKMILPQTTQEFEDTVLSRWRAIYKHNPAKLLSKNDETIHLDDRLSGVLFCQDYDTAVCLNANHLSGKLNLAITFKQKAVAEILQKRGSLPVYVLHDASADGIEFLEKTKLQFGNSTKIADIGLRPQSAMKSNLPKLWERSVLKSSGNLTSEEIEWLKNGNHTPLYVLTPEKLIKYVTGQIDKKSKLMRAKASENKAEAVGFMTWVGE